MFAIDKFELGNLQSKDFKENTHFSAFFRDNFWRFSDVFEKDLNSTTNKFAIFIPPDEVFDMLTNVSGLSFKDLFESQVFFDIMFNHWVYFKSATQIVSFKNDNVFNISMNQKSDGGFLDNDKNFTFTRFKIDKVNNITHKGKIIDLYTTSGILATVKQREFLSSLQIHNPFADWIFNSQQTRIGYSYEYYLPSNYQLDQIYKNLKLANSEADEILEKLDSRVKDTFVKFWKISRSSSIPRTDEIEINGIPFTYSHRFKNPKRDEVYFNIQYIEGFLTTPELTLILQREIIATKFRIQGNFNSPLANAHNPLRLYSLRMKKQVLPDISILDQFYKQLGINSFAEFIEQTRFSKQNLEEFFSMTMKISKSWYEDYSLSLDDIGVSILETEKLGGHNSYNIYYISRIPEFMINKLKQIMINNSNSRGDLGYITADPLQLLTEGKLKGRNLIALCGSNAQINRLCNVNNQRIFVKALFDEFNIVWKPNLFEYDTPRELYKQMHTEFYIKMKHANEVEIVKNDIIYSSYYRNDNPKFDPKDKNIEQILAPSPKLVEIQKKNKGITTLVVSLDKYSKDYMFAFIVLNDGSKLITQTELKDILGDKFPIYINEVINRRRNSHDLYFTYMGSRITYGIFQSK